MKLPFTTEQFLFVFQQYNRAVWPMQIVLTLLALVAVFFGLRYRPFSTKLISAILAFFWLWMGIVYHILNFTIINPAAYAFGILYILQGALFLYAGWIKQSVSFRYRSDVYGLTGVLLILYALLIYPVLGYFLGHVYPQSPTFGLPCPTTIFTFGILLWTERRMPLYLLIIPIVWSLIGFSAALTLGIQEDIGLLVAAVVSSTMIIIRNKKQSHDSQEVADTA
jgi:hypothetical protein